jgi:adenylate kinase
MFMKRLVDPLVLAAVIERIAQSDARHGFVLDGFPRTISQAVTFDDLLHTEGGELDHVIELHVDEEMLPDRKAREAAQAGGAVRADDNHEALKVRIDAYRQQTAPLIDYRSSNVLKSVDGLQPVDAVTEQSFQVMERRQRAISNTVAEQAKSGRAGRSQVLDLYYPEHLSKHCPGLLEALEPLRRKGFGAGVRNRPKCSCDRSIRSHARWPQLRTTSAEDPDWVMAAYAEA